MVWSELVFKPGQPEGIKPPLPQYIPGNNPSKIQMALISITDFKRFFMENNAALDRDLFKFIWLFAFLSERNREVPVEIIGDNNEFQK
jgi:hypothetical protein